MTYVPNMIHIYPNNYSLLSVDNKRVMDNLHPLFLFSFSVLSCVIAVLHVWNFLVDALVPQCELRHMIGVTFHNVQS